MGYNKLTLLLILKTLLGNLHLSSNDGKEKLIIIFST